MSKRLDYIDSAKGFSIIFIIAYHLRILPTYLPHLCGACVPLFFILSGIFFKSEEKFKFFLVKKINTILIPFLFFYCIPYIIFYFTEYFCSGLIKTQAKGILDMFTQEDYFNGPIWFLLSLFWDFIILWGILNLIKNIFARFFIVLCISVAGVVLSKYNVFLPLKLAPAFTCLIFLYFGNIFKSANGLNITDKKPQLLLLAIAFLSLAIGLNAFFSPIYLELYNNTIIGNVIANYLIVTAFTLSIIFFCKIIGSLPLFSYFGEYSLIPLCIHHIIYRPILLIFSKLPPPINSRFTVTIITILIIYALIPFCLKYIPYFCGEKNLINLEKDA